MNKAHDTYPSALHLPHIAIRAPTAGRDSNLNLAVMAISVLVVPLLPGNPDDTEASDRVNLSPIPFSKSAEQAPSQKLVIFSSTVLTSVRVLPIPLESAVKAPL